MHWLAVGAVALAVLSGSGGAAGAPSAERPSLAPIQATFYESLRSTWYRVELKDGAASPAPVWTWSLTPDPADPTCNKLTVTVRGVDSSTAIFPHGDVTGCLHQGPEHNIEVEVAVQTGDYTCNARIKGTLTRPGPEPEPCFRKPSTPPPKASAPPEVPKNDKPKWGQAALVNFSGGGAQAGMTIVLLLAPDPTLVTKGAAIATLVGAVTNLGMGLYATWKYLDPPDPNYKRLAKVTIAKVKPIRSGNGVTPAIASATTALLENAANIGGVDDALLASFERAQGAYAAKDGTWDTRQSRAAAGFARAEAKLLDARPALESALMRAVAASGSPIITAADAAAGAAKLQRAGLPADAVAMLRSLSFTRKEISAMEAGIPKIAAAKVAGRVTAHLAPPSVAAADRLAARLLRSLATSLDKR